MMGINQNYLVLGFFDGIHLGHQQLFACQPHRFEILTFKNIPNKTSNFLYCFEDRLEQLEAMRPVKIHCMDLVENNMTGLEFIQKKLLRMNPAGIIAGNDFRFGSDSCSIAALQQFFPKSVFFQRTPVASKAIKQLIINGDLNRANNLLVEPYYRTGIVREGSKQGRYLGFPTANMEIQPFLVPMAFGSYITTTLYENQIYPSVSFIGASKTLNHLAPVIETHLINFNENLYGKSLKVRFHQYLRLPEKFDNLTVLKTMIAQDVKNATKWYENNFKNLSA